MKLTVAYYVGSCVSRAAIVGREYCFNLCAISYGSRGRVVVTLISWGLVQIAMSPGTPEFVKALSVKYEMTLTLGEMSCGRTNINALPTFVIRTPLCKDEGPLPLVEVDR
jgi:hypothetical protein